MADETSETSATASSGGNWWSSGAGAGPNGLSQWSCNIHNMLLPAAVVTQPCSTSALTNIQWSSDIPNSSGSRAGDQDVDNLSNSSNLSHQDLVDSGTALLDSSVQMDHFGGVSDNNAAVWTQVLLGTSGSGEAVQNTSVGNLHEVLYTRAPRQELLEPSDHLQKTQEAEVPSGWEFRPSFPSFQAEDHMSLGKPAQMAAPLLYNPQLLDERLHGGNATLSDLGSWSVAPPDQASGGLMSRNICLNTFSNSELGLPVQQFDLGRIKQECPNMTNYSNALGISPNALLQGFGAEPNYKNVQEGFSHILESANKPFLKSLSAHAATGACCSHINAGDQHHHHEYNPHGGRWPISPNMSTSTQLPVALSQLLLSSPSKQATNVLNFGANKQHFDGKQMHNIPAQHRTTGDEARDSCTDTKRCGADQSSAGDTIFKRPRLEATTTVPPFKVRKEKLGDRITALQQLVSPFGKTDTASVLLEAIGYIKFLQEQVQVLSTPYMKSGGTSAQGAQDQKGWGASDNKDPEEPKQDLRSRGLCLVPVSCTLHVANDNGADFWTPSLGSGSYR